MNEPTEAVSPEKVKASPLIKICLVGLPVGLILTTTISFLFYFGKRENQIEPVTSHLASIFRKEVNVGDLGKYQQVLRELVGQRDLEHFNNLDAASSYIDSTMGFDNMGYRVLRQEFLHEGKSLFNLMAELPGKKEPDSVILVVANYVSSKENPQFGDKAVASLFSLAHAMTGEAVDKTIRFVAVANLNDLEIRQTGAWYLSKDFVYPKEVVEKVYYFDVPGFGADQVAGWDKAKHQSLSLRGANVEPLDDSQLQARLEEWLKEFRAELISK